MVVACGGACLQRFGADWCFARQALDGCPCTAPGRCRCLEQGQGAGGADAEAAAAEQLRQEAAAGVAALGGACTVSVAHDFWLHVLEKHEGPGPRQQ